MRILHVITGKQKAAGTSVFAGEVCNMLVQTGHEATIAVCNPAAANSYPLDLRVNLISIDSIFHSSTSTSTSTFNFDLVHIHALWSPILVKVQKWAWANKIPVVWSPHGMLTPWAMHNKRLKKLLGWWLYQRAALRRATLLHATAESEVEDIRRMGLENPVVIAPLGVHVKDGDFHSSTSTPNFNSQKRTLLFVSRVQRKKGLPNLLEAWARLKKVEVGGLGLQRKGSSLTDGWTVRIVGPDQDNHTAELKAQCDHLGLTYLDGANSTVDLDLRPRPNVIFVGPKYGDDLTREYASADLFVLPTHSENFGSVVIESLAQGVPVICTKGAPWSDLEEHHCGWWIDIGVDPLVRALTAALSASSEDLRTLGANGRALVKAKYTWGAVGRTMATAYGNLLHA